MTSINSKKWITLLDDITKGYNSRASHVLQGLTPSEAHEKKNEEFLRKKFIEEYHKHNAKFSKKKPSFKVGDTVRIVSDRNVFSRGYNPGFSQLIHEISEVKPTAPRTYKIKGMKRSFYAQELVSATFADQPQDKKYFIEKTRKIHSKKLRSGLGTVGQTEYLLKALNDPSQSSWISEFEYNSLKNGNYLS